MEEKTSREGVFAGEFSTEGVSLLKTIVGFLDSLDFKKQFANINIGELLIRGYVRSGDIQICKDLSVEVRTLLVSEWIACKETANKYKDPDAKHFAFMVEYLVYSLIKLNGSLLVMDHKEIADFKEKHGREPTLEEQARHVLMNVVPPFFVELLWLVAWKFKQDFDEVFTQRILDEFRKIMEERNAITSA